MSDNASIKGSSNEFDIPMGSADDSPAPDVSEYLAALSRVIEEPEAEPSPEATKAREDAEAARKASIDEVMAKLEDESDAVRDAVRTALEAGADAKQAVRDILAREQAKADESLLSKAEEQLAREADALQKVYPGFTEGDLKVTLEALAKLPQHLAEALTLEEVAARALGRATLEARRQAAPAPGDKLPPVGRTSDAATIIGDATPGPGNAPTAFDPGTGADFMDIANHVTRTAGNTLVSGATR